MEKRKPMNIRNRAIIINACIVAVLLYYTFVNHATLSVIAISAIVLLSAANIPLYIRSRMSRRQATGREASGSPSPNADNGKT